MSSEYLKQLSEELKEAREKSKLTIEQIFTKTRIDKKYLNAIENGNFSIMPEVYIRAFIKEYAKAVGLVPSDILSKYELAKEGKSYSQTEVEEVVEPDKKSIEAKIKQAESVDSHEELAPEKKTKNMNFYYLIGAFSMLLTIFIIYKIFLTDDNEIIVAEKSFEEVMAEEQISENEEEGNPAENDKQKIDPSQINAKGLAAIQKNNEGDSDNRPVTSQPLREGELTLTISGLDKSWIRVVSDGVDNVEFIIEKGMTKVLYAKEKFYLHVGNSGGVKLYLNNKDIMFRGSPGKVRKIFVTESGIEYLRRTPVLNVEQE